MGGNCMIRTIIQLPEEVHNQLREIAHQERTSISAICRKAIENYLKEASPMKARISIPSQKNIEIQVNDHEEAFLEFEQALWNAGILANDDNLSSRDLEQFKKDGFLNYGHGADLPCVEIV